MNLKMAPTSDLMINVFLYRYLKTILKGTKHFTFKEKDKTFMNEQNTLVQSSSQIYIKMYIYKYTKDVLLLIQQVLTI